jgi:hypothetical protein
MTLLKSLHHRLSKKPSENRQIKSLMASWEIKRVAFLHLGKTWYQISFLDNCNERTAQSLAIHDFPAFSKYWIYPDHLVPSRAREGSRGDSPVSDKKVRLALCWSPLRISLHMLRFHRILRAS